MIRRWVITIALFAGLAMACHGRALASLHVCDRTPLPVTVALGVLEPSASGTASRSQGWWQIDSGMCVTAIDADLQPSVLYYLYAKSVQVTWPGSPKKNSTDLQFCTNAQDGFNYFDRPASACTAAGDEMLWFIREPVNGPDWTINLDVPT